MCYFFLLMSPVLWYGLRILELLPPPGCERWIPKIVMEYFPASDDQYGYCPWTGVLRHSLDIDVNMDIACSMRIIKQNAIQSLYAGSKSRRWAVVNECELTNHSGYLEIWRHMRFSCFWYYIAFAMEKSYGKLHIILYYRLLRSCKAEVTWRELCGLQNSGLPILAN